MGTSTFTRRRFLASATGVIATMSCAAAQDRSTASRPVITKLGTIDIDLVETTPVVFKGKVFRFEYVRERYWSNKTGDSYFRFVERETGAPTPAFAKGYHLGSAMSDADTMVVTGTNNWNGEKIDIFTSNDLETWEHWNVLHLPGYGLFNTSLCRAEGKYVLMFEVGKPEEVAGVRFTARFAVSNELKTWELTPSQCTYSKDRYTAPHCLRYLDGYYYNFYLESVRNAYEQRVVRSRDLIAWESSPLNPVLRHSDEDKVIANRNLNDEQRQHVQAAENRNNSDIDFCEFEGRLIITYSWGDQRGKEFLAEAVYDGSEADFLRSWFPAE